VNELEKSPGEEDVLPEVEEPKVEQTTEEETVPQPLDAVMVFGIGPVQPGGVGPEIKHRGQLVPEAKLNAIAAAQLYLEGKTKKIIFTGGRTGKDETGNPLEQSEGEMMRDYVVRKFSIPEEACIVEDKAANTIENIARSLTPIDENPEKFLNLGFLGSPHHVERIAQMAELFGLEGPTVSSAKVIDEGRLSGGSKVHRNMEHYRRYFEKTLDPEANPIYAKRLREETRWSKGLETMPQYFLPQLKFIENDARLLSVLLRFSDYLEEKGIKDLKTADPDKIRDILGEIKRELPPQEWERLPDELPEWRVEDEDEKAPPFKNENRSEIEDPVERFRNVEELVFCDVDGTLTGKGGKLIGRYIQMAERCYGMVILASSRGKQNLSQLKESFGMNALAPIVFENGAGVAFPSSMVNEQQIREAVQKIGGRLFDINDDGSFFTIELSPPKDLLKEQLKNILQENNVAAKFITDMTTEEVMETYHCTREEAENTPHGTFMENLVFTESDPQKIQRVKEIAASRGLHLTRAKMTWHLMSEGVHKGNGVLLIKELMKTASGRYRESVAFGDAPNDFEMFEKCEKAYMVGDEEGVKLPPHVNSTASSGPMGVTEGFRELFLKKE